jgi:outer membrane protein assembly factor BamB
MKMVTTYITVLMMLTTGLGCKKEPVVPNPPLPVDTPTYQTKLDIKWIHWYTPDSAGAYYLDPVFIGDYVAFCTRRLANEKKGNLGFAIFHKSAGFRHPIWDQYYPDLVEGSSSDIPDWQLCGASGELAVLTTRNRLYAWDLNTGQIRWKHNHAPNYGLHRHSSIGSFPYHTYYNGSETWSKVARFNPNTGIKEDLVTISILDNFKANIFPVESWINPLTSDTILLFVTGGWNFTIGRGRVDAYAFNQTTRTMMWHAYDICPNGNAAIYAPVVAGNKVVFQGLNSIHCFDIPSGTLLWEHSYDPWTRGFSNARNIYREGKVFVRDANSVLAYDITTGTLLWETTNKMNLEMGGTPDLYQGKLYFTASDDTHPYYALTLFCVDVNTGAVIWKDPGPNKNGGLTFGVIIDQSTGYLYATDAFRMMCIDLNNTPKP